MNTVRHPLYEMAKMMWTTITEDLQPKFSDKEILSTLKFGSSLGITMKTLTKWTEDWKEERKKEIVRLVKDQGYREEIKQMNRAAELRRRRNA